MLIIWKRNEIMNLRNRMENLFEEFFNELTSRHCVLSESLFSDWTLSENEKEFIVEVKLPDTKPGEIEVSITGDNLLTIKARKEEVHVEEEENEQRREERCSSAFHSIRVPERVKQEEIRANYSEGILRIVLPKVGKTPFQVKIKN